MRICVVFNPAAKGDKARRFRQHLAELGPDCVLKPTGCAGDGHRLATEAVEDGFETVVAAGGDGTVNEVLNGIAGIPGGLARTRLGVLPLGTANVFARELRLPLDWRRAWRLILEGSEQSVDLVRVRFVRAGQPVCRHFVQVAGAGLDGRATELVDWQWKKKVSYLAYITAGLRALREPQFPITVETDTGSLIGELVLMGNGRLYGGPFPLFPSATLRDGLLDVRVFPKANPSLAAAMALGLCTGRIGRAGGSTDLRVAAARLSAPNRVPLQLDGEYVGELPAEFQVEPRGLRVLARGARDFAVAEFRGCPRGSNRA
ncbi:MAG: diacylglycerol kinase family lipid kinase [Verrucomicrobia bacterium]|nr:diacylglycerol kinase family lipid kinase [Verrucomicrobiota bacterium]